MKPRKPSPGRRDRANELARIRMFRRGYDLMRRPGLDDLAPPHHIQPARGERDDAHVMGNQENADIVPGGDIHQEFDDRSLQRDIKRGRGLVGDDQLRPAGNGDGDHRPLQHAAR